MNPGADRLAAALADRYRVERELGAGGMATVYLAEDLKHDRKVAIKVLKPELAAVLGAERFVVEIKTTAAMSHPHILPLFDSGTADGFLFYVMPYIQGETIREKLNRETQFGVEEAVRIAREVADALDYAHRHGVIHRDIKPENILLHDGRAMVMDFGIALAVSAAAGGRMTETGLSLGTPHYMSPEQATADKAITGRSDIYSLASVLYEMLTGEPPHMGTSAQQIIMKIIAEPVRPAAELRKAIPPHVAAALETALEKLPADRFESAHAFAEALGNPGHGARATVANTGAQRARLMAAAGWAAALLATLALGWTRFVAPRVVQQPGIRFAVSLRNEGLDPELAISRDGRRIAMTGRTGLILRDLAELEPRVIAAPLARKPSFSPDGRWLAFGSVYEATRKVLVDGGSSIAVSQCADPDWLDAERLVCLASNWGLGRVSSTGGPVEELTVPDTAAGEVGHWSPVALPGGKAVLFTSYRRPASRIEALDLKTRRRVVIAENAMYPVFAKSGHVLFVRDGVLLAVRFDPETLQATGAPVPMLEDIAVQVSNVSAGVAISDNGTLAVVRESQWWVDTRVVWVDRDGRESPAVASPGAYSAPRISPDQRRIVLTVGRDGSSRNLCMYDRERELLTQLTRNVMSAFNAVWSPDSREVVFTNETPSYDLYRMSIDGTGAPNLVVANRMDKYPRSVSPDGQRVAYEEYWSFGRRIRITPFDGSAAGRYVGDSTAQLSDPVFSPDGRWIAVGGITSAGAASHIFILRSDGQPGVTQVTASDSGDTDPRWTKGGRELVFRRGSAVYAVDINADAGTAGKERKLFDGAYPPSFGYDVTPDGNRFLLIRPVERPGALPIVIITNFFEELRRKAGA